MLQLGVTYPAPGVMQTKPATAPTMAPTDDDLPFSSRSRTSHVSMDEAAAISLTTQYKTKKQTLPWHHDRWTCHLSSSSVLGIITESALPQFSISARISARFVLATARGATPSVTESADPPLKPTHPNQRRQPPRMTNGTLAGPSSRGI